MKILEKQSFQNQFQSQQLTKFVRDFAQIYQEAEPICCIIQPENGLGGIYQGNIDGASNLSLLSQLDIRAVLTVASRTGLKYNEKLVPMHEVVICEDADYQNLYQYFERMFIFIEKARAETNVLIHCVAGISRSATAIIMYLMKKFNWTLEKAYYFLKTKRRINQPNPGFMKQLQQFEKDLQDQQFKKNNEGGQETFHQYRTSDIRKIQKYTFIGAHQDYYFSKSAKLLDYSTTAFMDKYHGTNQNSCKSVYDQNSFAAKHKSFGHSTYDSFHQSSQYPSYRNQVEQQVCKHGLQDERRSMKSSLQLERNGQATYSAFPIQNDIAPQSYYSTFKTSLQNKFCFYK